MSLNILFFIFIFIFLTEILSSPKHWTQASIFFLRSKLYN